MKCKYMVDVICEDTGKALAISYSTEIPFQPNAGTRVYLTEREFEVTDQEWVHGTSELMIFLDDQRFSSEFSKYKSIDELVDELKTDGWTCDALVSEGV